MSQTIEPYNLFERTTIVLMCLNLSATGAYFVRRMEVWKRVTTGSQNFVLHSYATGCIFCSWLFTFMSIIGILFVDFAPVMWCRYSIYTCITFYWGTKVFIYLYLVERALIVKSGMEFRDYSTVVRLEEKTFQMNAVLLLPYLIVLGLMLGYNIAEPTEAERCEIGLKREAALALAVYDTIFSVTITIQFVIPLFKKSRDTRRKLKMQRSKIIRHQSIEVTNGDKIQHTKSKRGRTLTEKLNNKTKDNNALLAEKIRALAIRSLIGSTIALLVSLANMISLTIYPSQPIAQCLLLCSTDVTIGCVLVDFMSRESAVQGIRNKLCCFISFCKLPDTMSVWIPSQGTAKSARSANASIASQNTQNSVTRIGSVDTSTDITTARHGTTNELATENSTIIARSVSIEIA